MKNIIGKCIGDGGTATVYEWGNNEVIKVFKPNIPTETIKNEEYIGKILNDSSLCIPKYIKTIKLNNKLAIIYERVHGKSLAEVLIDATDKSDIAANFARTHYEIHQYHIDKLPSQHDMLNWNISKMGGVLGDNIKKMQELLDNISIENKVCHGDFHPLNIMVDCDKYTTIDWNGSCSGNPLLDVAWSYLTLNSPAIESIYGQLISNIFTKFSNEYLNYYCQYANINKYKILMCLPIVAIRRLYDNSRCETDISKYEDSWLKYIIFLN